jgi:hypothetical protein
VNAPLAALARAAGQEEILGLLRGPLEQRRRLALHFRLPRRAVPEAMAARVLRIADPEAPLEGANLVALRVFHGSGSDPVADVVVSAVVPADATDAAALVREIAASAACILPFAATERARAPEVRWDTDDLLPDPEPGSTWPADVEVRAASRQAIYCLDRCAVAPLGVEGDLLLGWRTGEAIIADLA